uniref:Uncharacterized protein n=1 Tax=Heliothis virescens TaxID=7102 RepID=A0A2A4J430_HELVI
MDYGATDSDFMDYTINDTWWDEIPPKSTPLATYPTLIATPSSLTPSPTFLTEETSSTPPISIPPPIQDNREYPPYYQDPHLTMTYDPESQPPRLTPQPVYIDYTLVPGYSFTFSFVPKDTSSRVSMYYTETITLPPWITTPRTYETVEVTFPGVSKPSFPISTLFVTTPVPDYMPTLSIQAIDETYSMVLPSRKFTSPVYTLFPGFTFEPGATSTPYPPPPVLTYIPDFLTSPQPYSVIPLSPRALQKSFGRASVKRRLRNIGRAQSTPSLRSRGVQSTPPAGVRGVQSTPPAVGRGVQSTTMGDELSNWLSLSTRYTPVENWISELATRAEPAHDSNANKEPPQAADGPTKRSYQNNMATTSSPVVRQGIELPDAYTQPQDYGFSTATGQKEKFIGENELGMLTLGTTPIQGDHTMTTMIQGAPAYKPYEVTMSTIAGDVLEGKIKVPADGMVPGDSYEYSRPPGVTFPEPPNLPGAEDNVHPGMTPPISLVVDPYKRYEKMMDELNEGYMMIFLMELTRLVTSKDPKDVYEVIQHSEPITVGWFQRAQVAWFGHPLVEVTMSIGIFLSEAETDAVRSYSSMMHQLLRTRRTALATDVNSIIDYADMLYEHAEGYRLFNSLIEFEAFPNGM